MAVPDQVRFANTNEVVLTYGDVRGMGPDDRFDALKKRLDFWLVGQTNELIATNENGKSLVYSPFPLVIMSCITLETLGAIFFEPGKKKEEPRDIFEKAAVFTDKNLKGLMVKGFKGKLKKLWPDSNLKEINSASDVIYKYFRNSMFHGYQANGVFITGDIGEKSWQYDEGYILIHPNNFWRMVRDEGYLKMFAKADKEMKASALKHLDEMLK